MILLALNNGYCKANQYFISKKRKKKEIKFPATFFYIQLPHAKILLDAGYSPQMLFDKNICMKMYTKLMQVECKKTTTEVLIENGIDPTKIDYIIVSHFHPDHIGGLNEFKKAKIICTEEAFYHLNKKRLLNVEKQVNKKYIPTDIGSRLIFMESFKKVYLKNLPIDFYNILNMDQLYGFGLPGHSKGQLGILIPDKNVLHISDAAWCEDNFKHKVPPRKITEFIVSDNPREYRQSLDKIELIKQHFENIDIVFTHDKRFLDETYNF